MSTTVKRTVITTVASNPVVALGRLLDRYGDAVTQASLSAIEITVANVRTGEETYNAAVNIASTIFDTYQTGNAWTIDSTGYNFRDTIPPAAFPDNNTRYQVEYKFTPTSGSAWVATPLIVETQHRFSD